jgi:pimeloyl-ACP methyl ester carboxylesterase
MMATFTTADGAVLAYQDEGEGLPVLALAGLTRNGRDFDDVAPHLGAGVRLIRLDSRGRGASEWTGAASYTVQQEASDVLALLDHLGLAKAAVLGTSRGGLLGMVLAATAKHRLLGLCLNDVGPVLEPVGLQRIAGYVGLPPQETTLAAVAAALPVNKPGFQGVSAERWQREAQRSYVQKDGHLALTYDPALRDALLSAMQAPPVDLWPFFDACADLPLALIRGANSDLLLPHTAQEMIKRRPDMHFATVPGRAHVPFLDEPESLACIRAWLAQVGEFAQASA